MRSLLIIFILIVTTYAYSQKKAVVPKKNSDSLFKTSESNDMEEFLRLRNQMLKEMHEAFQDEDFSSNSLLGKIFEEQGLSQGGMNLGASKTNLYESRWEENDKERILIIKPLRKDVPLDIKINNQMISIGAKEEKKEQGNSFASNFMSSTSLPMDVDGNKAEIDQKNDEILVHLPKVGVKEKTNKKNSPKIREDGTKPLQPEPGDITI
jgi:HSP20 family molecular chaperone IbpA